MATALRPDGTARTPSTAIVALLVLGSAALAGCSSSGGACTASGDCARGQVCVSGTCQALGGGTACTRDDQCGAEEFCDADGRCKARAASDATLAADAPPSRLDADTPDTGVTSDAEPAADAVVAPDAEPPIDADSPPDAEAPRDAAPAPDAQVFEDADLLPDVTVFADATVFPDVTVFPDAAPPDSGIIPCTLDGQCGPPTSVCLAGRCSPGCAQAGAAACLSGQVCNPASGRCQGCGIDADCLNANLLCLAGSCATRCDRPGGAACGGGTVCNPNDGRCVAGSVPLGGACGFDAQCTSGLCLGLTVGGTAQNICASACARTSECPLNFSCLYLSGMNFCLGEALFTPPATFDTPPGGTCSTTNNTCQSNWCNTQAMSCIETCQRPRDCVGFGGACSMLTTAGTPPSYDHLCLTRAGSAVGAACTANANCASGVCNRYTASCAQHCCTEADCGAGQRCALYDVDTATGDIAKVCAPSGTGVGALGSACITATQCESSICAPVDTAVSGGPSQCSTLCCNNADCAALAGTRCVPFPGPTVGSVATLAGVCAR